MTVSTNPKITGIPNISFSVTAAETSAGVTPTNSVYPENDIRRYALTFGTDDSTAWTAVTAVATKNGRPVYLAGLTLKFLAGITWVYSAHGVEGQNAVLDFTALTGTTPCLTVNTANSTNYQSSYTTPFRNFTISGPGIGSTVDGIQFGTTTSNNFGAFAAIDNFYIKNCRYGLTWSNNAWLQSIGSGKISTCLWGIYFPSGLSNSGECINLGRMVVATNTNGVYCNGGNLQFVGLALDYNTTKNIYCQGGGAVRVSQFHLESSFDADYWLLCQDSASLIELDQGDIQNTSTSKTAFPIGQCSNSGAAQINLGSVAIQGSGMSESKYGFGYIIDGHCTWNTYSYLNQTGSSGLTSAVPCNGLSMLLDGGFEKTTIVDWISTGSISAAISSAQHYAGAQSMVQAPTAVNTCIETVWARCAPGASVLLSLRVIGVSNATDVLYFNLTFIDRNGNNIAANAISRNITTIPTVWTRYAIAPFGQAPAGTCWVRVDVAKRGPSNTNSDGSGSVYYDDMYLTVIGPGPASVPLTPAETPPVLSSGKTSNFLVGIPRGMAVDGIRITNSTANAVTGGVNIGLTDGATDFASAVTVGANADVWLNGGKLGVAYSVSASGSYYMYFHAVTAFNSANLSVVIHLRRILTQGY